MKIKIVDRKVFRIERDYFCDGIKLSSDFVEFLKVAKENPGDYKWTGGITESMEKLDLFQQSQDGDGFGATLTKKGKKFIEKLSKLEDENITKENDFDE